MHRLARPAASIALAFLIQACSATPCAATPRHDEPVPASEPRASLSVRVDLAKTASCEETFDLALYENRAIDRIDWDGPPGKCAGRHATIRYLPGRIGRDDVIKAVSKLATKVEVLP